MKKIACLITSVILFVFISSGQNQSMQLDQIKLLSQFNGNWKGEFANGTMILDWQIKPIANNFGSSSYLNLKLNGNTIVESWSILAYEKEIDKIVWFDLLSDGTVLNHQGKFTEPTVLEMVTYSNKEPRIIIEKFTMNFIDNETILEIKYDRNTGVEKARNTYKRTF